MHRNKTNKKQTPSNIYILKKPSAAVNTYCSRWWDKRPLILLHRYQISSLLTRHRLTRNHRILCPSHHVVFFRRASTPRASSASDARERERETRDGRTNSKKTNKNELIRGILYIQKRANREKHAGSNGWRSREGLTSLPHVIDSD